MKIKRKGEYGDRRIKKTNKQKDSNLENKLELTTNDIKFLPWGEGLSL